MTESTTVYCTTCGVGVNISDRFCPSCGAPVAATYAAEGGTASLWDVVLRRLHAATLGEFEIKRELGRGGMAAVYLAHEIALDRKVALKVMAPGIMMADGMVDRFRLEAVTVANLSHPNIVRVHAVRQVAEDLHFIVMQYIGGRTLERVLREVGPLPPPVVGTILGQVGRALAHAHKRGVVHRDVKPGNVMLDGAGDVVVTDFGIAKVATAPSHTLTGSVVGTPSYMSPEQCHAQPLTGASDQYSLGVVAFEMLTGRVPFTGAPYAVMHGHTHGEIPDLRALRPDCPADLADVVARMLAKAPETRFASMSDAVSAVGAPPLGEQDPLRDELARLAAADEAAVLDAMYPTPVSPVPRTRAATRPVARPATPAASIPAAAVSPELLSVAWRPAETPVVPAGAVVPPPTSDPNGWTPRRVVAWTVPFALAVGGAAIVLAKLQPPSEPSPSALVPPAAAPTEPRLAESRASTPAAPAGASAATPGPLVAGPQAMPGAPRHTNSTGRDTTLGNAALKQATEPPGAAPSPPTSQPTTNPAAPLPTRKSAPETPPVTAPGAAASAGDPPGRAVPPAKTLAELRAELDAVVASYARAIETEDVAGLRAAYPAISPEQINSFRSFFDVARDIRITIGRTDAPAQLQGNVGSEARVRVEYRIEYVNTSLRRAVREANTWQAVLERTGTGWRVLSIR